MKYMIALFLFSISLFAQEAELEKKMEKAFAPNLETKELLEITPSHWQFGTIHDHTIVHTDLQVKNNSTQPVTLTSLPTLCGCVAYTPKPEEIAPGEEAKVFVEFNPKGKRGLYEWKVELSSDLPGFSKISVPMSANVLRKDILSERSVDFGIFQKNSPKTVNLWLTCHKQKDFQLLEVLSSSSDFTTSFLEEAQVEGFFPGTQRGYKITITPQSNVPYGRHRGKIILKTNISGSESIEVPLWAYVQGEISTVPDYVSFGLLRPGKEREKRITVYHNKMKKFKVMKVESSLPFVRGEIKETIPEKYYYLYLTISVPDDAQTGEFRGTINVHTDYPGQTIAPIQVQGFIRE